MCQFKLVTYCSSNHNSSLTYHTSYVNAVALLCERISIKLLSFRLCLHDFVIARKSPSLIKFHYFQNPKSHDFKFTFFVFFLGSSNFLQIALFVICLYEFTNYLRKHSSNNLFSNWHINLFK